MVTHGALVAHVCRVVRLFFLQGENGLNLYDTLGHE
jgi:hypothetical protein